MGVSAARRAEVRELRKANGVGAPLTDRERQVVRAICGGGGRTDAEAGTLLGIDRQTVKNHVCVVLAKLGLRNARGLCTAFGAAELRRNGGS